jgi:thymidylate synthase
MSLENESKNESNEDIIIKNVFVPFYNLIEAKEFVIDKSGVKTVEILGLRMELNPEQRLLNFYSIRKSPEDYIKEEIKWYDSQDLSVKDISKHAKIWANICTKDDRQLVNSNYGYLIYNDKNYSQYSCVKNELILNRYSRRAIMIYNRPSMQYEYNQDGMSDFICTLGHQFFIRDNKLISLVEMRSSDMLYGFFSDFPWFATVQERLLIDLKEKYPELSMGKLIWISNSAHLYEKHFDMVEKIINTHLSVTMGYFE